jgi:hypothetical protein
MTTNTNRTIQDLQTVVENSPYTFGFVGGAAIFLLRVASKQTNIPIPNNADILVYTLPSEPGRSSKPYISSRKLQVLSNTVDILVERPSLKKKGYNHGGFENKIRYVRVKGVDFPIMNIPTLLKYEQKGVDNNSKVSKHINRINAYVRGDFNHIMNPKKIHAANLNFTTPTKKIHASNLNFTTPPTKKIRAMNLNFTTPPTKKIHTMNLNFTTPPTKKIRAMNLNFTTPPTKKIRAMNLNFTTPPTKQVFI